MSIRCSNCGTNNRNTAKFCMQCATQLTRTCPACATDNPPTARFCHQCATSLSGTSPRPVLGTGLLNAQSMLAGRYIIVKRVGQGGMGAVYTAKDTRLGHQVVAVKEMSDAAITSVLEKQQAGQAFEQEAQMLAMLKHQHLPRVTDHFSEGGKQYLVMDFIDGHTLEELLDQAQGPLEVQKVVTWGTQLCEVLGYLHSQTPPIIFRDLKPANIMVDQGGKIKLIDFGIARLFKSGQTTDTTSFGTAGYAPSEQYGKGQTDARSDLYALGATLHHLLTGRDPADSPFNFPAVRTLNAKVPQPIEQAIMRAVEPDPDQRWQNAHEMRNALAAPKAVPKPVPKPVPTPAPTPAPKAVKVVSATKIAPPKVVQVPPKVVHPTPAKPVQAKSATPPAPTLTRVSNGQFLTRVVVTVGISLFASKLSLDSDFEPFVIIGLLSIIGQLAYMLTRRPGAAFLAYTLNFIGLITFDFTPNPRDDELLPLLAIGVAMEVVLALRGYDKRSYWTVVLASIVATSTFIIGLFVIEGPPPTSETIGGALIVGVIVGLVTGSIAYVIGRMLGY